MRALATLFALLTLLSGCQEPVKKLLPVEQGRELVVVTHNGPATYYVTSQNEYAGLEYDLARLFAQSLGEDVKLRILLVDNVTAVIPTLLKGRAHLAAANLTITPLRQHLVRFGPPYQTVRQQVIYNRDSGKAPRTLRDLAGKSLTIPAGTSYAERLREAAAKEPGLHWREAEQVNSDELLEQVATGTLDLTVVDSHLVAMKKNLYPNLGVAFDFGPADKLAWAFPKSDDEWLYQQAQDFIQRIHQDGTLRNLLDRYYGHSERLEEADVKGILGKMRTTLPRFMRSFKEAQELTGLDWRLLAAIGYQESHWDPYATSPTNVRGLMMLTEGTADRLGVTDRLDAHQSILGGARYVALLKESIPDRIAEPDRTWLALAAYNIGIAHLEDARVLAQRMKLNPDSWADVKKTLPLLNQYEYFSTLKYGYASGGAPVIFVESIRTYYNILQRHEQQFQPVVPSFELAAWPQWAPGFPLPAVTAATAGRHPSSVYPNKAIGR